VVISTSSSKKVMKHALEEAARHAAREREAVRLLRADEERRAKREHQEAFLAQLKGSVAVEFGVDEANPGRDDEIAPYKDV
jgi:hypothetical protein